MFYLKHSLWQYPRGTDLHKHVLVELFCLCLFKGLTHLRSLLALYGLKHARILCLLIDVLFEVTVEIKPKDWIPHGGSELQKGLLESMKNHVSLGVRKGRKNKCDVPNVQLEETMLCPLFQGFSVKAM